MQYNCFDFSICCDTMFKVGLLLWLGLNKLFKIKQKGPRWEFYKISEICFNTVRAVLLEIFGYIQAYMHTYINI